MAYCDGGSFSRTSTGLMEPGSSIGPCWKSILNGLIRLARVSMDIMSLSSRNNFTALTKWAILSNVGVEVGGGKCTSCRAMLSWQSCDASLWQRRWVRIKEALEVCGTTSAHHHLPVKGNHEGCSQDLPGVRSGSIKYSNCW